MFGSFSKLVSPTGGGGSGGQTGCCRPSRFVVLNTDGCVAEASSANASVWGISQPSTHRAPLPGWDTGYAGIGAGITVSSFKYVQGTPPINVFGQGDDECLLELGGTVAIGDRIKTDNQGRGVTASADADRVGAICHKVGGVVGDTILVKPIRYDIS